MTDATWNEAAALARLREDELALDVQLEEARREAQTRLARARDESERLKTDADVQLAQEVETIRADRARELDLAIAAVHGEIESRVSALRRRAEVNRERAVAFLLTRVTASEAT